MAVLRRNLTAHAFIFFRVVDWLSVFGFQYDIDIIDVKYRDNDILYL